jgi:hypothetical protein
MSNHYFAINRGLSGQMFSGFTLGTSSSSSSDIELRLADADGQGKPVTREDVLLALKAFERLFQDSALVTSFPPF